MACCSGRGVRCVHHGQCMDAPLPSTVAAAYLQSPSPQRETMLVMRERILGAVPEAEELMKYGMPTFVRDGVAFAGLLAHTRHVGYHPYAGKVLSQLPGVAAHYRTRKSAIHVLVADPLPTKLIPEPISAGQAAHGRRRQRHRHASGAVRATGDVRAPRRADHRQSQRRSAPRGGS